MAMDIDLLRALLLAEKPFLVVADTHEAQGDRITVKEVIEELMSKLLLAGTTCHV
jgi:hypothetical protein